MDVFRFTDGFHNGKIVNGLKTKMWIERYTEAGEFKFTADRRIPSVMEDLPIGSYISHARTGEIMIVENHEISENEDGEAELIISGRGFETILDNITVGSNKTYPNITANVDYAPSLNFIGNQIKELIEDHITYPNTSIFTAIPNVHVHNSASGFFDLKERPIKRGSLYQRVLELLNVNQFGIKVVRPGPWVAYGDSDEVLLNIHTGQDSRNCLFSSDSGQIESAEYLWSLRGEINAVLVSGKWVEVFVETDGKLGLDRRSIHVDASDIDNSYSVAPTGTALDDVVAAMRRRGRDAMAGRRPIALAKVEIAKQFSGPVYVRDIDPVPIVPDYAQTRYSMGDLVTVLGNYNQSSSMRVIEYVEVEDENGELAYPTFIFGENVSTSTEDDYVAYPDEE